MFAAAFRLAKETLAQQHPNGCNFASRKPAHARPGVHLAPLTRIASKVFTALSP